MPFFNPFRDPFDLMKRKLYLLLEKGDLHGQGQCVGLFFFVQSTSLSVPPLFLQLPQQRALRRPPMAGYRGGGSPKYEEGQCPAGKRAGRPRSCLEL